MILSTQTHITAARFGLERSIRMLAETGFDAVDFSMFEGPENEWMHRDGYRGLAEEARRIAEDCGVYFNQAHAPFPTMRDGDDAFNARRLAEVRRAIEIAGIARVRNIVVHPVVFADCMKERNLEMYAALQPYAEAAGVKIALENMWGFDNRRGVITKNVCSDAASLAEYADALDPDWFTVCLDLGHVGLVGDYEAAAIRTLGAERLTCLHVHDTDYRNDLHTVPFAGRLPWKEIMEALAEIGYKGDLTLEADSFIAGMPNDLVASGLRFMHDAGRQLIRFFEA